MNSEASATARICPQKALADPGEGSSTWLIDTLVFVCGIVTSRKANAVFEGARRQARANRICKVTGCSREDIADVDRIGWPISTCAQCEKQDCEECQRRHGNGVLYSRRL